MFFWCVNLLFAHLVYTLFNVCPSWLPMGTFRLTNICSEGIWFYLRELNLYLQFYEICVHSFLWDCIIRWSWLFQNISKYVLMLTMLYVQYYAVHADLLDHISMLLHSHENICRRGFMFFMLCYYLVCFNSCIDHFILARSSSKYIVKQNITRYLKLD